MPVKRPSSSETWVPLSRGLEPYLGAYSPWAIMLWVQITMRADWRLDSRRYGTLEFSIGPSRALEERERSCSIGVCHNLAARLGWDPKTIRKYLKELTLGHPLKILTRTGRTAPPFIEILAEHGTTKGKTYLVRLCKAKLSAKQFTNGKPRQGKPRPQPPDAGKKLDELVKEVLENGKTPLLGADIPE